MKTEEFIKKYGEAAYAKKLQQTKDWCKAHREHLKGIKKAYYNGRSDIVSANDKAWRKAHLKEARANDKAYRETHIEKVKANNRKACAKYAKTAKGKANHARFDRTEKGKVLRRKHKAKRRTLGFIELNTPFPNSEGHHITKEFIIYMPAEMHRSVTHNVFTGKNMEKINNMAIDYCLFTEKEIGEQGVAEGI